MWSFGVKKLGDALNIEKSVPYVEPDIRPYRLLAQDGVLPSARSPRLILTFPWISPCDEFLKENPTIFLSARLPTRSGISKRFLEASNPRP